MAAISNLPLKLVGTHAGISIGEDGPSQMGLEDLAMMCAEPDATVLYPADATSAWRATWLVATQPKLCYVRTGRPASPVLYGPDEPFAIGKCKVLRYGNQDRALVVAAGVPVAEALQAHDMLRDQGIAIRVIDLFSVKPIDREELVRSTRGGRHRGHCRRPLRARRHWRRGLRRSRGRAVSRIQAGRSRNPAQRYGG